MGTMAGMGGMAGMSGMSFTGGSAKSTVPAAKAISGSDSYSSVQAFSVTELQERLLKAHYFAASEANRSQARAASEEREPTPEPQRARVGSAHPPVLDRLQVPEVDDKERKESSNIMLSERGEQKKGPLPIGAGEVFEPSSDSLGNSRFEAAKRAAQEIKDSLERKCPEPSETPEMKTALLGGAAQMGVVIHWSEIRGFGILRCKTHGEIFVHAKHLGNCKKLELGEVVTFEVGFDRKKQKPEAVNCLKAGAGCVHRAILAGREGCDNAAGANALGTASITNDPQVVASTAFRPFESSRQVSDAILADAATAAAMKLLSQGLVGTVSKVAHPARRTPKTSTGARSRSSSSSSSSSGARSRQPSRRKARSRSRR